MDRDLDQLMRERLERLGGSHRKLRALESSSPNRLIDELGREVINFSSNDYLGLSQSNHETMTLLSQPSSRLLSGNLKLHLDMEALLADWLGREKSLIFPTGYMANMGLLSTIVSRGDTLIMDRLCHASLMDGAVLSRAKLERFHHLDMNHLESILKKTSDSGVRWLVCESLYSMDGDCCDFKALTELKEKYGFYLITDEAHAIGVYGEKGRGLSYEHEDIVDIVSYTLSKSFAMQGGVIAGSKALMDLLTARCRSLIYTTATPISHLHMLPARLNELIQAEPQRKTLLGHCDYLEKKLHFERSTSTPIIPFFFKDGLSMDEDLMRDLDAKGIYCPAILPPTVAPGTSRLRISLTAAHTRSELDRLIEALPL